MIQVHYIHCAFYFYYCDISSTSDHQALEPRVWRLLSQIIRHDRAETLSSRMSYDIQHMVLFLPKPGFVGLRIIEWKWDWVSSQFSWWSISNVLAPCPTDFRLWLFRGLKEFPREEYFHWGTCTCSLNLGVDPGHLKFCMLVNQWVNKGVLSWLGLFIAIIKRTNVLLLCRGGLGRLGLEYRHPWGCFFVPLSCMIDLMEKLIII